MRAWGFHREVDRGVTGGEPETVDAFIGIQAHQDLIGGGNDEVAGPVRALRRRRFQGKDFDAGDLNGWVSWCIWTLTAIARSGQPRRVRRQPTCTVTRRNVAGINVVPGYWHRFWLSNSATSSLRSAGVRPSLSAASKAFIVGP